MEPSADLKESRVLWRVLDLVFLLAATGNLLLVAWPYSALAYGIASGRFGGAGLEGLAWGMPAVMSGYILVGVPYLTYTRAIASRPASRPRPAPWPAWISRATRRMFLVHAVLFVLLFLLIVLGSFME